MRKQVIRWCLDFEGAVGFVGNSLVVLRQTFKDRYFVAVAQKGLYVIRFLRMHGSKNQHQGSQ